MYAIIRAGGKQAKVREGDVIDVERIKSEGDSVTFTPLLLVSDDGTVISDKAALEKATVSADVLGESRGEKIDIFKYKNKTGYRRRQGHRQRYNPATGDRDLDGGEAGHQEEGRTEEEGSRGDRGGSRESKRFGGRRHREA